MHKHIFDVVRLLLSSNQRSSRAWCLLSSQKFARLLLTVAAFASARNPLCPQKKVGKLHAVLFFTTKGWELLFCTCKHQVTRFPAAFCGLSWLQSAGLQNEGNQQVSTRFGAHFHGSKHAQTTTRCEAFITDSTV